MQLPVLVDDLGNPWALVVEDVRVTAVRFVQFELLPNLVDRVLLYICTLVPIGDLDLELPPTNVDAISHSAGMFKGAIMRLKNCAQVTKLDGILVHGHFSDAGLQPFSGMNHLGVSPDYGS